MKQTPSKFNWVPFTQILIASLLITLVIPTTLLEIRANANCTTELKNHIQKQINILTDLENAPTIYEQSQKNKKDFEQLKNKKIDRDLSLVKIKLEEEVKTKYKLNADVNYDYTVEFTNPQNTGGNIQYKAIVHRLTDFKDGAIDDNTFEFDILLDQTTKNITFREISQFSKNSNSEDIEISKKLQLQNTLQNGDEKANSLGQSDEEWAKLKKLKAENQSQSTKISPEKAHKDLRTDKRLEYREQKKKLQIEKDSVDCRGILGKAELWNTTYNRNAAVNYANNWWNSRNNWYADFDNNNLGGDCTNFAAQVMQAGGYQNDSGFYSERTDLRQFAQPYHNTYPNNSGQWFFTSPSFRGVVANKQYVKDRWYTSDYYYWKNWKADGSSYSGYPTLWEDMFHNYRVTTGDIVYADWQNDGIWDHTMIITDWYQSYNKGWLPKLSYHSTNRNKINFEDIKNQAPNANFVTMKLDNK